MVDVIVLCEGHTEREFCNQIVSRWLAGSFISLKGTLPGNPDKKNGGIRPWSSYRDELLRLGRQRPDWHIALLVDYYGLPDSWPGQKESRSLPVKQRGAHVEEQLQANLTELSNRFHPCVQLHEFESLLFVEPRKTIPPIVPLTKDASAQQIIQQMEQIKAEFSGDVQAINHSVQTAPSKRLKKLLPGYDKVAGGIAALNAMEPQDLRQGCTWLDRWLKRLESLVN